MNEYDSDTGEFRIGGKEVLARDKTWKEVQRKHLETHTRNRTKNNNEFFDAMNQ